MTTPRHLLAVLVLVAGCAPAASPTPTGAPATATPPPSAAPTPSAAPSSAATTSCAELGIPGGRIAFTVGNGQANGLGVVSTDGSNFHMVVEAKDINGQPHGGTEGPSWIGPGRILFDSNRNGGPDDWHLFTVDEGGDDPVQITKGDDGIEYHGDLSPDGTFVVYAKAVPDPKVVFLDAGLFVADPDGRHERQVTETPAGGVDEWPDISPGRKIAFTRGHVGDGGLYTVNVDGSSLTRIVPASMEPLRPRWSSDGRRIVFHTNGSRYMTESANVWVVNADGSGLTQLTFEKIDGQAFYPTWSPDDEFILFVHHRRGSPTNDLGVVPSSGGDICTLWQGGSGMLAWESDWAPIPAIVGTWRRKQTCESAGCRSGVQGRHPASSRQHSRLEVCWTHIGSGPTTVVTFDVKVPPDCPDPCGTAYFWALSAFASGPWTQSPA